MSDIDPMLTEVARQTSAVNGGEGVRARANLSVDVSQIRNLNTALKDLQTTLNTIKKTLPDIVRDLNSLGAASGGLPGKGQRGAGPRTSGGVDESIKNSSNKIAAEAAGAPTEAAGGGGGVRGGRLMAAASSFFGGGRGALLATVAKELAPGISAGVQALDRRIDRGAAYALSADRTSLLYQQMTGLSQTQVQDKFRQPLTKYRLGEGGINTLLGLQAETGLNAAKQASSVEALRTVSGFTLGTGDISNMMSALARPETVNRMFMMTGQSMYGFGGRQNSTMGVVQNLVKSMGLTNKAVVDSAFQAGSVTRDRLRMAGVPEDMITTVLQYAKQNITFKEKGGRGMYDPSKKEQRERMGVEDNFATQFEETTRVREGREEKFYSRQADNLADMERMTQKVTKALGKFEDMLSGIVGARTSTRPVQKAGGGLLKTIGNIAAIAGTAAMFIPGAGTALGLGIQGARLLAAGGAAASVAGGALQGDGEFDKGTGAQASSSTTNTASRPRSSDSKTANKPYMSMRKYRGLKPKFAERLYAMLKANSRVHIETGWRSSKVQENLFFSRYKRTDEKTDLFWDGSYWKHVKGPAAAPPGRSMHEIGLAADLKGDLDWVQKNAHKFGLKTFAKVNNEPWHVQPEELPNSRRAYERAGAPWGTDPNSYKHDGEGRPPANATSEGLEEDDDDALPATDAPTRTPSQPVNNGTSVISADTKEEERLKRRIRARIGASRRVTTYGGASISQILSARTSSMSSAPFMQMAEKVNEGDGSFYNGLSERTNAEAPVFSIPTQKMATPAISSNKMPTHRDGDIFNINPTVNLYSNGSGVTSDDLRKIAREVGRMIEEEARIRTTRRN